MLIFDQLKKNDPQLQLLAMGMLGGLILLLAGLWWVQIVKAGDYRENLETQSSRSVRVPAVRGKILDRNGIVLAENRPSYSVNLYLDELSRAFERAGDAEVSRARQQRLAQIAEREKALRRPLTRPERRQLALSLSETMLLRKEARYTVASNLMMQVSQRLQQPLTLDETNFQRHCSNALALPYPVLRNLSPLQVARFEEQCSGIPGMDLEIQSTRLYSFTNTAAHVLGYLVYDDRSIEGEDAFFTYRLPDYRGVVGVEGAFDTELHGHAGGKAVIVNYLGYRQSENVWNAAEPGHNVVLTLDMRIQQAAERALRDRLPGEKRGAVVVMDVRDGDLLALASSPTMNPNWFLEGFPSEQKARWSDEKLGMQKNRATQVPNQPASTFKTIVGLAALEEGLDPNREYHVSPDPRNPGKGLIKIGDEDFHDLAPPGDYDFRRAFIHSSNVYFITNGIRHLTRIVQLAQRLHLGEPVGLPTRQEASGHFPTLKQVSANWSVGDTANICIGQGRMDITPVQMAVLTTAIANGGKVFWPRLVERIEPQDPISGEQTITFDKGRVRDELGVRPGNLQIVQDAMRADVTDPSGTGTGAAVPGFPVCGKTGTAQHKDARNVLIEHVTWFISFAPYGSPRYAVVVMVESGVSGGITCAPIAHDVYVKIQELESRATVNSLAGAN